MSSRVATATLDTLRHCGDGRRECVVYWVAGHGDSRVLDVVHPRHSAGSLSYQVDGAWVTQFFLGLGERHEHAVAQVHSHPGSWVGHSAVDDVFVLVPSVGFVSLVVPSFGTGSGSDDWGIWQLSDAGTWTSATEVVNWTID